MKVTQVTWWWAGGLREKEGKGESRWARAQAGREGRAGLSAQGEEIKEKLF